MASRTSAEPSAIVCPHLVGAFIYGLFSLFQPFCFRRRSCVAGRRPSIFLDGCPAHAVRRAPVHRFLSVHATRHGPPFPHGFQTLWTSYLGLERNGCCPWHHPLLDMLPAGEPGLATPSGFARYVALFRSDL